MEKEEEAKLELEAAGEKADGYLRQLKEAQKQVAEAIGTN